MSRCAQRPEAWALPAPRTPSGSEAGWSLLDEKNMATVAVGRIGRYRRQGGMEIMRRMSLLLAVAALTAALLAGCVVVPYGGYGWYGEYHPYHHYYWHRGYYSER